jgi:formylglycine-generating enzyme required for sulfatase activity
VKSTDAIPQVQSIAGDSSFFQRLMCKTGNRFAFDLPTEVMAEIAERAGATTYYYWGNAMDERYVVCSANSGGSTVAVGSKLPNAWGLYDTCGNVFEWTRDDRGGNDLASRPDAFTPAYLGSGARFIHGGGHYNEASSSADFCASIRANGGAPSGSTSGTGFRVAVVLEN